MLINYCNTLIESQLKYNEHTEVMLFFWRMCVSW